jgi:UDP-N-acetylglucosamine:LPS N-acetylglucosamine transferase
VVLPDRELTPQRLENELAALLSNEERRATLSAAARALGRPDSAQRIVACIDELAEGRS